MCADSHRIFYHGAKYIWFFGSNKLILGNFISTDLEQSHLLPKHPFRMYLNVCPAKYPAKL